MIVSFLSDGRGYNILEVELQDSKYPINGIYALLTIIYIKVNYALSFCIYVQENYALLFYIYNQGNLTYHLSTQRT